MIHKYLTIVPAVAALLLAAGCSDEDVVGNESGALVEIRLTSSVQSQTRATCGLDQQIASGETVAVWVDDAGTGESLYEGNEMTVGDDGYLSGTETMYFPTSGNAVDIYAIHGNLSYSDSFWNEAVTHTVAQDQTSSGTGYATSDLVYGKKEDVARTRSAIELSATHLLSKVEVVLRQDERNPSVLKKLEILNTQLQAVFTPDKGNDITVTATGETGTIVIDSDVTEDEVGSAVLNEAILVPQTLSSGTQFIRIITGTEALAYTLTEDVEFAAGKKYRYNITISQTGLEVSVTVDDWETASEVTEEMEVQPAIIYKTDLSTAKVGDLITSNGELIDVSYLDYLTDYDKEQVVGVVYWVPEAADESRTYQASLTDDKIMASEHPDCTHGLAVGLVNISSGGEDMQWQPGRQFVGSWQRYQDKYNPSTTDYVTISTYTDLGGDPGIINYILGYQNTKVLRSYNNDGGAYEEAYEVLPVIRLDRYWISAPAGSTGWFLPSIKELHMLCYKDVDDITNANGSECTETRDIVNASLEAAGGSRLASVRYWSSTEYGYSHCYIVDFADASVITDGKNCYSSIYDDEGYEIATVKFSCYARPVCAF